MRIRNDGNVGIGTSNPSAKLTVADGMDGSNSQTGLEFIPQDSNNRNIIFSYDRSSSAYKQLNFDASDFRFNPGGSTKMVILNNGNVGIGTTNPNGGNLHVQMTGVSTGITNVLMNASFNEAGGVLRGLNIGYRTDENTAVLAPRTATGNLAFYNYNGAWAETARFTNTGRMGIGTANPDVKLHLASSPGPNIRMENTNTAIGSAVSYGEIQWEGNDINADANGVRASIVVQGYGAGTQGETAMFFRTSYIGNVKNQNRMIITHLGDVGIGVTGPLEKLSIQGASTNVVADVLGVYTTAIGPQLNKGIAIRIGNSSDGSYSTKIATVFEGSSPSYIQPAMVFYTMNNTYIKGTEVERMRIKPGGTICIGKDNEAFNQVGVNIFKSGDITAVRSSGHCLALNRRGSDGELTQFYKSDTKVGTIQVTGSATTYNTSSDYRLKKNIKPLEDGLDRVCKLKPVKFDWKLNDETTEGFIAHEVQEIFPDATSGEKDGEDMQGMDYGRITPLLVKAIQELKAEIEILKNKPCNCNCK